MTNSSPITPPPELVQQLRLSSGTWLDQITNAYQAGADQELEACVNWLADPCAADMPSLASDLRYSRRPKPLSLKEQAYDAYWVLRYGHGGDINETQKWNTIRRALEALPND